MFPSGLREVVCDISTVRGPVPLVTKASALNYKCTGLDGLCRALILVPWSMLDNLPVDDAATLFHELLNTATADHLRIPLVHLRRR